MIGTPAIVIGYDHYNTLNLIRALGGCSIPFHFILVGDPEKSFTVKSKYVNHFSSVRNPDEALSLLLNQKTDRMSRSCIITSADDIALKLSDNHDRLSQSYILPFAKKVNLREAMEKNRMTLIAEKSGFAVPYTQLVNLKEIQTIDYDNIPYPCLIKANMSATGSKEDLRICNNDNELRIRLSEAAEHNDSILLQQYIPSDDAVLVAGCRTSKGKTYLHATLSKPKAGYNLNNLGATIIGEVKEGAVEQQHILNFLDSVDYSGVFAFEFLRYQGKLYFIETNFRSDATLYIFNRSNANYPALWIQESLGIQFFTPAPFKPSKGMNEFQYIKSFISPKSIISNMRDILSMNVFSIFSWKDPKPFLYKFKCCSHD